MDVFEYRATRVVDTEGVFEIYKEDEGDLSGMFLRLKNLTVSEIHTQWDIAYLETYVKGGMVPRSLRWEVSPQKGDVQLEDWFSYFNKAGIDFLIFLIDRKKAKLTRLDEEIKGIKDKMSPLRESNEYKERSLSLLTLLEKEERDQRVKKRKKFNRDLLDYQGAVVFEWQKKLLAEQASTDPVNMETVPAYAGGLPPSVPYAAPPPPPQPGNARQYPGGHIGPQVRSRQGFQQSPARRGGRGKRVTSNYPHALPRRSRGMSVPHQGGRGRVGNQASDDSWLAPGFGDRPYDQYNAYADCPPTPRAFDFGSYPDRNYESNQNFRHDYYERRGRGSQIPGPSNNGRGYPDYNISTSNCFYPLNDLEGPAPRPSTREDLNGGVLQSMSMMRGSSDNGGVSGPSDMGHQRWGFHRPGQGIKRSADQREDLEGGGDCEQKKKKS